MRINFLTYGLWVRAQKRIKNLALLAIFCVSALFLILSCKPQFHQGKAIYLKQCSNCHGAEGEGLKSLYPPLKNADYLSNNIDLLPCIIRNGIQDTIVVEGKIYSMAMAGFPKLSEVDMANLVNYILAEFTSKNVVLGLSEVKNRLDQCN